MAESPEHEFLKHAVNGVLEEFSRVKLYTFAEASRKLFDFASLVERDWKRLVVGQVLWKHGEGLEKDLRTLMHDAESEIKVYVARDEMKHRQAFAEIVNDYHRSGRFQDLYKLKAIWVPHDFDADRIREQTVVRDHVKNAIVDDVLFNVVFGNISEADVQHVLDVSGIPGLQLAILHVIATEGFVNIRSMSDRLGLSAGPIREKLLVLAGAGMITTPRRAIAYKVTSRGRVLLDIVVQLQIARDKKTLGPELAFILTKLGCPPLEWAEVDRLWPMVTSPPFVELLKAMRSSASVGVR